MKLPLALSRSAAAALPLAAALSALTGCATSFDPANSAPAAIPGVALKGTSFGGRQPIAAAHIYVLRAGATANGGPDNPASASNLSPSLLTTGDGADSVGTYVLTDANGRFSVSTTTPAPPATRSICSRSAACPTASTPTPPSAS